MASPFLRLVPQQHNGDCTVACLSTLLGEDYEDVLTTFSHNAATQGTQTKQIIRAARVLGHKLRYVRRVALDTMTGIVVFGAKKWQRDHAVVLKNELIFDPQDATLWESDDYVRHYKAKALYILVEDDE